MDIITQTKKIYNSLCDDLSGKIFENRLLFSLTANREFIRNIIKLTTKVNLFDEINSFLEQYNDIIIYGAGIAGKHNIFYCITSVKSPLFAILT